ncbi:hypothetical protein ACQKCH_09135 [Nubsella zeaxanthinifaciens]|uniref:hypothetical protein n=1 Tax=Nubsella zeaxanthinifaciens TaxID=392412 RepID=UPI003D083D37
MELTGRVSARPWTDNDGEAHVFFYIVLIGAGRQYLAGQRQLFNGFNKSIISYHSSFFTKW